MYLLSVNYSNINIGPLSINLPSTFYANGCIIDTGNLSLSYIL